MTIHRLPFGHRNSPTPLMLFIDLQNEYIAEGRSYFFDDSQPSLSNCRKLLSTSREQKLPIIHTRQLLPDIHFNENTEFAQWIPDFRPRANEIIIEHSKPSCYTNEYFSSLMESIDHPSIYVMGFAGEASCLSTIIDAYHRNHEIFFISDASHSSPLAHRTEKDSHEFITDLISNYSTVITAQEALLTIQSTNRGQANVN